jgi:hypothetical protein
VLGKMFLSGNVSAFMLIYYQWDDRCLSFSPADTKYCDTDRILYVIDFTLQNLTAVGQLVPGSKIADWTRHPS